MVDENQSPDGCSGRPFYCFLDFRFRVGKACYMKATTFFFVFLVQFTLSSLEGPFFVTALEVRAIWNENSVVIKAAE